LLLAQNAILVPVGDTGRFTVRHNEEGLSWETSVASGAPSAEIQSQLSEYLVRHVCPIARRNGIDIMAMEEWEEYVDSEGVQRRKPTARAKAALGVVEMLSQGYTPREAVKIQQRRSK